MQTVKEQETRAILAMGERIKELEMLLAKANREITELKDLLRHK
jgi:uncharacterized coiled-coil protein SlyX